MTVFLRLLAEEDKETNLLATCKAVRSDQEDGRVYQVNPTAFKAINGIPFAYWASDKIFDSFERGVRFQNEARKALRTNGTTDDGRWIRAWWETEVTDDRSRIKWIPHAKGGAFSPFYSDLHLIIAWDRESETYPGYQGTVHRPDIRPASLQHFFKPGLTWSRRNSTGLSFRVLPRNTIFGDKGPAIVFQPFTEKECMAVSAILNSSAFRYIVSLQLGRVKLAQSYEAGVIQGTPFPDICEDKKSILAVLAQRAWSLKRTLDTVEETSHAFLLPTMLRGRLDDYNPQDIEAELERIQTEIDDVSFDLYAFGPLDRVAALAGNGEGNAETEETNEEAEDDVEGDEDFAGIDQTQDLLCWAVGVVFGRFDWRLATKARGAPPEPAPFDPLPTKSPGMLPDDATPFHAYSGVLVEDQGHADDLAHLVEEVLAQVEAPTELDVRRWLERDFFKYHLKQYGKSRRKAPIYWPLSTNSSSYTLWFYYPSLTGQTIYTAVNDFIEPKLKQVGQDLTALRAKGSARSRADEKNFETIQVLEQELIELRDTLLEIAPTYRPNQDDGVQIAAAPLWRLFRHKPWQKLLKSTWEKLEKGEYDWAHLAMTYWPDRVREKCKTDKSLAIAHDLENLYEEPEGEPRPSRSRTRAGGR